MASQFFLINKDFTMMKFRNLYLLIVLSFLIAIIQSCGKDDDFVEPDKVVEAGNAFDNIVDITGNGPKKDDEGFITTYYLEEGEPVKKLNHNVTSENLKFQKDTKSTSRNLGVNQKNYSIKISKKVR